MDKFEELFYLKRKHLEEFLSCIIERVELEEAYARGIEKIAHQLAYLTEKRYFKFCINNLPVLSLKSSHL